MKLLRKQLHLPHTNLTLHLQNTMWVYHNYITSYVISIVV